MNKLVFLSNYKNKNVKFEQKLVEIVLASRSHSSQTVKLRFNKKECMVIVKYE